MATDATLRQYLTIAETADLLGIHPSTVYRRLEDGELPGVQLGPPGSAIRIPRAGLDAWLWSERGGPDATRG
jgi:excisionase family DNA binding protein